MGAIAFYSIQRDPSLIDDLLYTPDSYGNNCGKPNTATSNMKKVIFPRLDTDIVSQMDILVTGRYWQFKPTRLCVPSCPSGFSLANPVSYGGPSYPSNNGTVGTVWYSLKTKDVVNQCFPQDEASSRGSTRLCVTPACTNSTLNATLGGAVSCTFVPSQPDATNVWEICGNGVSSTLCAKQEKECELEVTFETLDKFMPKDRDSTSGEYTSKLALYFRTAVAAVEGLLVQTGLYTCLVMGVLAPIVLGLVWSIFLYFLAGPVVWILLVLELVAMVLLVCWLVMKAGWWDAAGVTDILTNSTLDAITSAAEGEEQTWYAIAAVIAIIVLVLNIIFLISARRCVSRLIAILQECSKVFKAMFIITVWPLGSVVLRFGVFVYFVFILYFIVFVWSNEPLSTQALVVFMHVFGTLWTLQLIRVTNWSSMAGAVGYWFVSVNAPSTKKNCCPRLGMVPLCDATWTILSKHLGSMAFGALVITIVQFFQLCMQALDYLSKEQQEKNFLLKIVVKCTRCCLWCLRKTVEFITLYGFIFVAIEGSSFCRACMDTFGFVACYPMQHSVNLMVKFLLHVLISIGTPLGCAVATFYYLNGQSDYTRDFNPIWAAIVVFLSSYIISDGVAAVYDVTIDTIFLCAFKDMKENNPPKFMSNDLREGFGIDKAEEEAGFKKPDSNDGYMRGNQVAPNYEVSP